MIVLPIDRIFAEGLAVSLEAVTSRLEDLAILQAQRQAAAASSSSQSNPTAHVNGAAPPPPPPPPPAQMAPVGPSVSAFDERIIDGRLATFVAITNSFAPPVLVEQVCRQVM